MKLLLVFVAVTVAVASAEYCSSDSRCTLTKCGTAHKVDCFKHSGSHVCTCVPDYDAVTCAAASDCAKAYGHCETGNKEWHCYDQVCACRSSYLG